MENQDTISLLKECNAGSKMAVTSLDEVLDHVRDEHMRGLILESRAHHEKLGNEIHTMLITHGSAEKDPNPIAKGMSFLKTNMKLSRDESDATVADLLTDGCDMGIKSLHKYKNKYEQADHKSRDICDRLIDIEEELREGLHSYL